MQSHIRQTGKQFQKGELENIILHSVAIAGIIGIAFIAPGVIVAMDQVGLIPGRRQKEIINKSRDRLIKKGWLRYSSGHVRLTQEGKMQLRILELKRFAVTKPKRWDKKWRVLIFDIPEYRRKLRNQIRQTLQTIGFVHLQHSVWLYPYDCEDVITLLKADFKIGKDVLYLVVDALEYDRQYRIHFGLK